MWVLLEGDAISPQVTPAELVQGRRGGSRREHWGLGSEPVVLACLQCLDLKHCPITHQEAPSQNTQRVLNTVTGVRKWQERKGIAGIATRERGPQRTAAVSDSSNTSTAILWGQRNHPQLPKPGLAGPEPAQTRCPGFAPHAKELLVSHPTTVSFGSLATRRLMPPPRRYIQEWPWPTLSSGCKAEMFMGSNFKLCP